MTTPGEGAGMPGHCHTCAKEEGCDGIGCLCFKCPENGFCEDSNDCLYDENGDRVREPRAAGEQEEKGV